MQLIFPKEIIRYRPQGRYAIGRPRKKYFREIGTGWKPIPWLRQEEKYD